jgi:anti-anti-sigma factor
MLTGDLDIASAPALRESLLQLLRPSSSRLIIDLSAVGYADASGAAVLVGIARRAGLLGGWLRLASPAPAVAKALSITGVNRHLATFPTVEAAVTGKRPDVGAADARTGIAGRVVPVRPVRTPAVDTRHVTDSGELRAAVTALLAHADAWRDADPRRRFVPAIHALARAYASNSHDALTQAANNLLSILVREPLTHSPEVAASASRLRRLLDPANIRPVT